MGRVTAILTVVIAIIGCLLGVFSPLLTAFQVTIVATAVTGICLFASYTAALGETWNTYVPIALLIPVGVALLDQTTGIPYGTLMYSPFFLQSTVNASLVILAVGGTAAVATWRFADHLSTGGVRLLIATTYFTFLSTITSMVGVELGLWTFKTNSFPAWSLQILGGLFTGFLHAVNGDTHDAELPLFPEHILSGFIGFLVGASITSGTVFTVILSNIAAIGHVTSLYVR